MVHRTRHPGQPEPRRGRASLDAVTTVLHWFGSHWGAPMCNQSAHIATPAGHVCEWCEHPIEADDRGVVVEAAGPGDEGGLRLSEGGVAAGGPGKPVRAYHLECHLRTVLGSAGHIERRCTCFGGEDEDPPGLTKREAAHAAVAAFERRHGTAIT